MARAALSPALDVNGIGYVLADHSVTARSPEGWATAVAAAAQVHNAQMVVAETNQGGNMASPYCAQWTPNSG